MLPWKDRVESKANPFHTTMERGRRHFHRAVSNSSRKTKRVERFKLWGLGGLGDRSRAPDTHPGLHATASDREAIRAKGEHPTWGPKKLVAWLGRVDLG